MMQQAVVWGALCLVALAGAVRWPRAGRIAIGVFFIVMAVGVNVVFALVAPDGFVELGTGAPLLSGYEWIFAHAVSAAPVAFGLAVAGYEVTIGVLMIRGGHASEWGLMGGIAFLVASSPLGPWTLPNVVLALALVTILHAQRRSDHVTSGPGLSRGFS
jgi:hypothetical protein